MKRTPLFAALLIAGGCAATTPVTADIEPRQAPIETVRVTVADVEIPVTIASIPLHTALQGPTSPAREHVRQLILSTRTP